MLIARPRSEGFVVVDAFSRITRLGEGLSATGRLSDAAMDRTIGALKFCAQRMTKSNVLSSRLVATEACRQASNLSAFADRVVDETGLTLDVISTDEEAALALAGCAPLLDPRRRWALVFDIGGGSTEMIWVENVDGRPLARDVLSLRVGVVTLAERYGESIHRADVYEEVVGQLSQMVAPFALRNAPLIPHDLSDVQMLGTSGTVTTLAALHLGLSRYDRNAVDGAELSFDDIDTVTLQLAAMSAEERSNHPCIGTGRCDLVLAGCAILAAMCRSWSLQRLRVADRGVREGVLLGLMNGAQAVGCQA